MKFLKGIHAALLLVTFNAAAAPPVIHIWETQELTFSADNFWKPCVHCFGFVKISRKTAPGIFYGCKNLLN